MQKTEKNILEKNKKVLVGISGGVDSSVAAMILKEQGYEVEGVFAKVWQPDFIDCTWRDEMKDAMRVCAKLDIPFHFLDLETQYKEYVAQYMIDEYQAGRTPNPDVMCNTYIKFGFIYDFAISKGFDFVATGHYAQNINSQLYRGKDSQKDQSYFLWNISKEKFNHILFPVGELEKSEVRMIANKNALFTGQKKDSQGLCFIGPIDMKSFLKKLIKTTSGDVLNSNYEIIGEHDGSALYTVGERHGFRIFPKYKTTETKPLYIISKNIGDNTIRVGTEPDAIDKIFLTGINFFEEVHDKQEVEVQFRYRQKPISAIVNFENGVWSLVPNKKQELIAEGQSVVFYDKNRCIGGAIIDKMIYLKNEK